MTRTEKLASLGKDADYTGKYHGGGVGRTVPQPFSVVNDPVVKIDYRMYTFNLALSPSGCCHGDALRYSLVQGGQG